MKASELIEKLKKLTEVHGDVPVFCGVHVIGDDYLEETIEVYSMTYDWPYSKKSPSQIFVVG